MERTNKLVVRSLPRGALEGADTPRPGHPAGASRSGGVVDSRLAPEHTTAPVGRPARGSSRRRLSRFSEGAQVALDALRLRQHRYEPKPASASRTGQNVGSRRRAWNAGSCIGATSSVVSLAVCVESRCVCGEHELPSNRSDVAEAPRLFQRATRRAPPPVEPIRCSGAHSRSAVFRRTHGMWATTTMPTKGTIGGAS